jgi:hypothetical protein
MRCCDQTFYQLQDHPDFSNESNRCQERMICFSEALSRMELGNFEPHPAVEAKDRDAKIAQDAATSRLLPIQDGDDQWEMQRSGVDTDSVGPAPG